jgi:hypothetical protein
MFRIDVGQSSITTLSSSSGYYYTNIIHHLSGDCFLSNFFGAPVLAWNESLKKWVPQFDAYAASTIANNEIKSIISVANGVNLTSSSSFILGFLFEHSPHSFKIVII